MFYLFTTYQNNIDTGLTLSFLVKSMEMV